MLYLSSDIETGSLRSAQTGTRRRGTAVLAAAMGLLGSAFLAGCGGDAEVRVARPPSGTMSPTVVVDTPTPDTPTPDPDDAISGQVSLPVGAIASAFPLLERFAQIIVAKVEALTAVNVEPVGAGVSVRLIRLREQDIDAGGNIVGGVELATAETGADGRYTFSEADLPLGIGVDTCRLLAEVGSGGVPTRAFVASDSVNINFESEAAVRLILETIASGDADLCDFDSAGISDINASVEDAPGEIRGTNPATVNAAATVIARNDSGVQASIAAAIPSSGTPTTAPATFTPEPPPTNTRPVATATEVDRPTRTATNTIPPTGTPAATATATIALPTSTRTFTPTNSNTTTPTRTRTSTSSPTETAVATATDTTPPTVPPTVPPTIPPTVVPPTNTNTPTNSPTEVATATFEPTATMGETAATVTPTGMPTGTAATSTPTLPVVPTDTPTTVSTDTPEVPTDTPTAEPTDTATTVPTDTPSSTPTNTFAPTNTPTSTNTLAPTDTPEPPTTTPTETPVPGLGKQTCVLFNTDLTGPDKPEESVLFLLTAISPIRNEPVGSLSIDCGAVDPLTGLSPCTCEVISIDAIPLIGIGDICVGPAGPCEPGFFACDGGQAIDLDTVADHNIGDCTSNVSCSSQCDVFCAAQGAAYRQLAATCEGFCQDGPNADAACIADSECPESNCPGKEPVSGAANLHQGVCNCACVGEALGSTAPAGSLTCNLGLAITVERDSDPICGSEPPSIVLAPICGPMSTSVGAGFLANANNGTRRRDRIPEDGEPLEGAGAPTTCDDFASGNLSGLILQGNLAFFDSALGDILTRNTFVCE